MTNADLIREARSLTSWYVAGSDWVVQATELMPRLADALEAAEAEVARLATIEAAAQVFFASDSWCTGLRDHVSAKACPCGYAQLRAAFGPAAPMEEAR